MHALHSGLHGNLRHVHSTKKERRSFESGAPSWLIQSRLLKPALERPGDLEHVGSADAV
jgi:hypothetical protein